ncbi:hypothetical protein [Desulfogranum japonicum]|uniref:hypothetical protein n=1 Tax=Desulfogranum japonicum TaxID=231447 RepID=UPI00040515A3|nr:hypothetical protein [Desulfogranum japonicum]
MNLFFYSITNSVQSSRVLLELQRKITNCSIREMPAGTGFIAPLSLALRSGDVVILHVLNIRELQFLMGLKDDFECFRKIICLEDSDPDNVLLSFCRQFSPRHIAYGNNAVQETVAVVEKMFAGSSKIN